jgi:hypothetical protein
MTDWYSSVYKAFIYASSIAFIIGFFTESKTSLGAYLAGYSILSLGIMLILITLFKNVLKTTANDSMLQILYSILLSTGPFILMLGVVSFILYLLIKYKNNIIDGNIAPGYNSFTNIVVILLLVQLYIVTTNINTEKFETTGKLSKVVSSVLYLIGLLTSISSIILYTILKYYSTDGFVVN